MNHGLRAEIQDSLPSSQVSRTSNSMNDFQTSQEPELDDFLSWKINRINMSAKLNDFRNSCIDKLNIANGALSRSEIAFTPKVRKLTNGIVGDLFQNEMYNMLRSEIKEYCNSFEEAMQGKNNQRIEEMLKSKYSNNGDEKLTLEVIENLYKTYDATDILSVDEYRFADIVFKPIFDGVMHNVP
ncbi:hypothetical protein BDC45DRAFT_567332 [Circinella umbellata]|nr:hypothetical protein BDC45DRAFT_567332 [Circinella umbellata]